MERYDTIQEGKTSTTSISVNSIDSSNDGQLVHFVTEIYSDAANLTNLTDPIFGAQTTDLKIRRDAEMYQWKETSSSTDKSKYGGSQETTTTYSYSRAWSRSLVNSNNFKERNGHENPSSMRFEDWEAVQDSIYAGAFVLPGELVSRVDWYSSLTGVSVSEIPDASLRNESALLDSRDGFYIGDNSVSNPKVGDMRVSFDSVRPTVISVIAQQNGDSFVSYEAEAGGSLFLFQQGNFTADELYEQAELQNQFTTWFFRFLGFAIMAGGIYLILRPIEVFADVLPILGDIVGCGLKFMAFTLAGILSGITIAIAWLIHHPKIGIAVLFGVTAFVLAVGYCVKKAQANKANSGPDPKPASDDPEKTEEPEKVQAVEEEIAVAAVEEEIVVDPESEK